MISNRRYVSDDYDTIMDFFREMFVLTGRQHCWLPQRWEYAEYNINPLFMSRGWKDWKEYIQIWEDNGKIVGIAHKEGGTDEFLQVRPNYEFLAAEMIEYLEAAIMREQHSPDYDLNLYVADSKPWLFNSLTACGYAKNDECSYYNYQNLDREYVPNLADGYRIVDGIDIADTNARARCCHLGFHPDDESATLPTMDFSMEHAPMFNPKLELMTQHEDGTLCSFCIIWYDAKLNIGMIEPVCTRINYRRQGLGRAMLIEGLRRLKEMGADKAYVESYGDNRRMFYNSAGFITYDRDYPWKKRG